MKIFGSYQKRLLPLQCTIILIHYNNDKNRQPIIPLWFQKKENHI